MIEPIAERREMALRHGAEFVIDPVAENQYERADEITDGRGYDVVIDASGSPRAVQGPARHRRQGRDRRLRGDVPGTTSRCR